MAKAVARPAPNSARTPNTTKPASLDRDVPPIPVWGAPTGITPVALVPVPPPEPVDAPVPAVPPDPEPVVPPVPDGDEVVVVGDEVVVVGDEVVVVGDEVVVVGDEVVVVVGGDAAAKLLVNVVAQVTVLPPPLAEPSH